MNDIVSVSVRVKTRASNRLKPVSELTDCIRKFAWRETKNKTTIIDDFNNNIGTTIIILCSRTKIVALVNNNLEKNLICTDYRISKFNFFNLI